MHVKLFSGRRKALQREAAETAKFVLQEKGFGVWSRRWAGVPSREEIKEELAKVFWSKFWFLVFFFTVMIFSGDAGPSTYPIMAFMTLYIVLSGVLARAFGEVASLLIYVVGGTLLVMVHHQW